MVANFYRRATLNRVSIQRDPAVQAQVDESREVLARNAELVAELRGVERGLREKAWSNKTQF